MNQQTIGLIGIISVLILSGFAYFGLEENGHDNINSDCLNTISDCPTELTLSGRKIAIDYFYVWRNDMPVYPPNSQRLYFVVELIFTDGLTFDPTVNPIAFRLVSEFNDTWIGDFTALDRPDCGINCLEKYAAGGPNWEGGTVVIPIIYIESEGNQYLLKGPQENVLIAS